MYDKYVAEDRYQYQKKEVFWSLKKIISYHAIKFTLRIP